MSAQHTPGPWHVVRYGDGDSLVICLDESGTQRVAFMAVPGAKSLSERRARWRQIKANAQLIAAAPDLLALAYQYRDDLKRPPAPDSRERRLQAIEAAIAKATAA